MLAVATVDTPLDTVPPTIEKKQGSCSRVGSQIREMNVFKTAFAFRYSLETFHL